MNGSLRVSYLTSPVGWLWVPPSITVGNTGLFARSEWRLWQGWLMPAQSLPVEYWGNITKAFSSLGFPLGKAFQLRRSGHASGIALVS